MGLTLTRGLTIQMIALSTLGLVVAATPLSGLYNLSRGTRCRRRSVW